MAVCGEVSRECVCVKLLVLFCVYAPSGQSARVVTEGNLMATVGDSVMFHCKVTGTTNIIMVEWTRCDPLKKILVFMPDGSKLSVNDTHQKRVTMTTASSFTLLNVKEEDFGLYCCKVNVYPHGVLEGMVELNQSSSAVSLHPTILGLPPQVVYILGGVAGAVLLVVVVTAVLLCKKRRVPLQDYVNVSGPRGRDPQNTCDRGQLGGEGAEEEEEEVDYLNSSGQKGAKGEEEEEDIDYLNVPPCPDD